MLRILGEEREGGVGDAKDDALVFLACLRDLSLLLLALPLLLLLAAAALLRRDKLVGGDNLDKRGMDERGVDTEEEEDDILVLEEGVVVVVVVVDVVLVGVAVVVITCWMGG